MDHYIYLFLLSYGVCYVIVDSYIFKGIREFLLYNNLSLDLEDDQVQLSVPRIKFFVELFTCYFCIGIWVYLVIYTLYHGWDIHNMLRAIANSMAIHILNNFIFRYNNS